MTKTASDGSLSTSQRIACLLAFLIQHNALLAVKSVQQLVAAPRGLHLARIDSGGWRLIPFTTLRAYLSEKLIGAWSRSVLPVWQGRRRIHRITLSHPLAVGVSRPCTTRSPGSDIASRQMVAPGRTRWSPDLAEVEAFQVRIKSRSRCIVARFPHRLMNRHPNREQRR